MKSTSILFVNLPTMTYTEMENKLRKVSKPDNQFIYPTKAIPINILYLSSYLKEQFGTSLNQSIADYADMVETLDNYDSVDDFILSIAKKSINNQPDIVAISLMFMLAYKFFKNIVRIYRSFWPNSTFVVGGIHATNTAKHILQTTDIDYVFRGEGEVSFAKFVRNYIDGQKQNIQGVYSKSDL